MKKYTSNIALLLLLLCATSFVHPWPKKSVIGKEIAAFSLRNVDGKNVSLQDYPKAKGFIIMFTCNHCPFAKLYTNRMNNLNKKYMPLQVPFFAINSMDSLVYEEESFEQMQLKAKTEGFSFPYLVDASQSIAKQFKAEHTPQVYVIWKEDNKWIVKYAGAFDDNGENPEKANPYVENAVNNLLLNQVVKIPETESFGCRIYYRK